MTDEGLREQIVATLDDLPDADDCVHFRHGFCPECAADAVLPLLTAERERHRESVAYLEARIGRADQATDEARERADRLARDVAQVIDSTEWYCADDHNWNGRARMTSRLRAALSGPEATP